MVAHKRHAVDPKVFICDYCVRMNPGSPLKEWSRRGDYNRHLKIHAPNRPHGCPFRGCKKTFVQNSALRTHMNTHTGAKPYKCNFCSKKFGDPSSCSRHKRENHSNLVAYCCPVDDCPTKLKRRACFLKHLRDAHRIDTNKLKSAAIEKMAIKRTSVKAELELEMTPELLDTAPIYTPNSGMSSPTMSLSPDSDMNLQEMYSMSPSPPTPYDSTSMYDYTNISASLHAPAHPPPPYSPPMSQQIGLPAIFNGYSVSGYYEHPYDDGIMIGDSSCSPESSSAVNWDLGMSTLAAERGYTTITPMYDC